MKRHSTYEIKEENIRKQLLNLSLPQTDDVWNSFSRFSESQSSKTAGKNPINFKVRMPRRLMVPAAAVLAAILLSLLLVNFLSGDNEGNTDREQAVATESFIPPVETEESLVNIQPPADIPEAEETPVSVVTKTTTQRRNTLALQTTVSAQSEKSVQDSSAAAKPMTTKKSGTLAGKKAKVDSVELLQAVQLPDIRPSLLPEEPEEDILPN